MIKPLLSDSAFIEDVRKAREDTTSLHIWWLGQSGFLVQAAGRHILLDPYLSDSLTNKYAGTDKPHVRMTERVIAPERLTSIDAVTSSHNHTDHLDAETLLPLLKANPHLQMIIPEANRAFVAERLGTDPAWPLGVDDGSTTRVGPFTFTGIPAEHEECELDEEGRQKYLGYIVQVGEWTLYHSGDTVLYDGMEDRLRRWPVDVAMLPINGRAPERRVSGNLSGEEAARLAKAIQAGLVIPCHFEMFKFNTASPDEFIAECERLDQSYRLLKAGERVTLIGKENE